MTITEEQRQELTRGAQSRTLPGGDVFRARLTLALAEGRSYRQIMSLLQTTAPAISRWKQRFEQAGIDGLDPVLPLSPGRHNSKEFVAFLEGLVSQTRWAKEIHVVLDNLSAHKTQDVERFLAEHPQVRFHFTPSYSSWLNQVELWFAKIQRDVMRRGVFTSVADLGNKLRRYIRAYSKSAKPFRWTYTDPTRRIHAIELPGQLTSLHFWPGAEAFCQENKEEKQAGTQIEHAIYCRRLRSSRQAGRVGR